MARQLKITDGTNTVDLLDTTVWGLLSWQPSDASEADIRRESAYSEGVALVSSEPRPVIETFRTRLTGTSHANIATAMQALATLKQEAKQWNTTNWQKTPVYLTAQTSGENGTRYALVNKIRWSWERSPYSKLFETSNNMTLVITVERESYWRNNIPLTLPTAIVIGAPQAPANQVNTQEQFIANFSDSNALTDCYNYDASLTAFSSNNIASAAFDYFVVSGSTPAVNDIVYFGSTTEVFRHIVVNIGTLLSASVTLVWEIWTGAAWVGSRVAQNSPFTTAGAGLITVEDPSGWTPNTINSVSAYWVRCRISAFTSWAVSPAQITQVVYNPRDPYITIGSSIINGDVDALAMIRYYAKRITTIGVGFVAIGLKSRGLTNFRSRLHSVSPAGGWTVARGADVSSVSDPHAPAGIKSYCTFSSTVNNYIIWSTSTAAEISDFEGEYNCYVRCQQHSGSAGDAKVRLTQLIPANSPTPAYSPLQTTGVIEYINLGRISIQSPRAFSETGAATLSLQLDLNVPSDTCDLTIYDLILIPVDEWAFVASSISDSIGQTVATDFLEMDGGIVRNGSVKKVVSTGIHGWFNSRGKTPQLPPDKALQLHFLFGSYFAGYNHSDGYFGGSVKLYTHERWEMMRGNE